MDYEQALIKESLKDTPIGESDNFIWYVTQIGIAAVLKKNNKDFFNSNPEKESSSINLDLSKEEKKFFKIEKLNVFLFYS